MPGAGCLDWRCCFDKDEDEPGCWEMARVFGFDYENAMDQPDHPDCWTGITRDGSDALETGCRGCDIGCDSFLDNKDSLLSGFLWVGSNAYMRSTPMHRWGRNAKNQIFDLRADTPTLIHRRCALEHSSCVGNGTPFYRYSCWGFQVCQCSPGPPLAVATCGVDAGMPVNAIRPIHFLLNFHGWPPSTGGTAPSSDLFCRKFLPTQDLSSPRDQGISVHQQSKNAVFIHDDRGMGHNLLIPCNGYVASSTCSGPDSLDCTTGVVRVPLTLISGETSSSMERVWIDVPNVSMTMRAKAADTPTIVREKQLYADVMSEVIGRTFPLTDTPFSVTFDRVKMFLPSNLFVDEYVRSWDGTSLDLADLPTIIDFPHSYTRWGRVTVDASMVVVSVRIKLKLNLARFADENPGPPIGDQESWLKRYAYFEIDVETAMVVVTPTTDVTIGGSPLVVSQPPWGESGFDGAIPTVTPDGNRIVYSRELDASGNPLPVRVPRKWRWVGRLGSFSDPVSERTDEPAEIGWQCGGVIDTIGVFQVPGLATANEDRPEDPNQNYDGSIPFFFVLQP